MIRNIKGTVLPSLFLCRLSLVRTAIPKNCLKISQNMIEYIEIKIFDNTITKRRKGIYYDSSRQ